MSEWKISLIDQLKKNRQQKKECWKNCQGEHKLRQIFRGFRREKHQTIGKSTITKFQVGLKFGQRYWRHCAVIIGNEKKI